MSRITLTDVAKKRLMGEGLRTERDETSGDIYIDYDSLTVSFTSHEVVVEMYQGRLPVAHFSERMQTGEVLTVSDLIGKLRIHTEYPIRFGRQI